MGLTVHYSLSTDRIEVEAVRSLVQEFRRLAQQIPFQEVGDIVEFREEACHYEDQDDPNRWLKIQASRHLDRDGRYLSVPPLHVIAFTTVPGDGSEPANIGLACYPTSVQVERDGRKQRLRTNISGWSWSSFCKTQYASNPECGGTANFVRCHLSVVTLLDAIKNRQLATVEVSDESDYWDHRDVRKLAECVGKWNRMVAAVVGQFKDADGVDQVQAPITEFPDYERLEAKGLDELNENSD